MPDLSLEASSQYWFDYLDPMIYRVITFMESVEDWTLDGNPDFEAAMDQLGKELDDIEKIDMGLLAEEDKKTIKAYDASASLSSNQTKANKEADKARKKQEADAERLRNANQKIVLKWMEDYQP